MRAGVLRRSATAGATRSHAALAVRAYAARFVADDLVEQRFNRLLAVALCRMFDDGLCSKCVYSGALCSAPGPTWPRKQFTSCCLPLTLTLSSGSRTLSQLQSLATRESNTQPLPEFRRCGPHLAMNVTDSGASSGCVALCRSSSTCGKVCS